MVIIKRYIFSLEWNMQFRLWDSAKNEFLIFLIIFRKVVCIQQVLKILRTETYFLFVVRVGSDFFVVWKYIRWGLYQNKAFQLKCELPPAVVSLHPCQLLHIAIKQPRYDHYFATFSQYPNQLPNEPIQAVFEPQNVHKVHK